MPRTTAHTLFFRAAVLTLFATLTFFSFDHLTESPPTWFDEGLYIQVAMNMAQHGAQLIQVAPETFVSTSFITGGYPFLTPISWAFDLFGIGLLQARIVMVFFMFAMTGTLFFLIRSLQGRMMALGALLLLITFPPLYGQGKNVLGEVPGLFFLGLFLLLIELIEKRAFRGPYLYVLAGLAAGLCVATKPIFLLLGPALLITVLLKRRTITFRWNLIALAVLFFTIPVTIWLVQQFGANDSARAVVSYYANPYAITDLNSQILTNAWRFLSEPGALYFLLLMGAWIFSVIIRIRKKIPLSSAECVAFTFSIIVWVAYLRTAGWYRYFFVAEILALSFLPYALSVIRDVLPLRESRRIGIMVFILALAGFQTYQLFFDSWVADHAARTTTHDMHAYIQTLPSESSYFLYNVPAAAVFVPTNRYYQYITPHPLLSVGDELLPLLFEGIPDILITDKKGWEAASTTRARYTIVETIDSFVIATRTSP